MRTSYVHIEVVEMQDRTFRGVEAEVRVLPSGGHPFTLQVKASGSQAPWWRVESIEPVASPEVLDAVYRHIAPEEFLYRISVALALYNVWDSAKAASDRWRQEENDRA
ncbi:MAG: hypothetical protein ACO1SV_06900 [Fimbriimonas sp.]